MALLEIKNLNFKYNGASDNALENVDLTVNEGEFVVVCGESGCGKSTLLKLLKKQLSPVGEKTGDILYDGVEVDSLDERLSVSEIGYVMQNPDNQIVTDKVWHELAFGLESLGEKSDVIRRKVAEVSSFFGINSWYRKNTSELSGGQKQLVNLASIMVMNPRLLILDEPTSQLDPIGATEFISTLQKINLELGMTIILVEHRLEEVFPIADKVVLMDKSKILMTDSPAVIGESLRKISSHKMNLAMPTAVKIYGKLDCDCPCPITIKEGKDFLKNNFKNNITKIEVERDDYENKNIALEISEGYFRYERDTPDILNNLTMKIYEKEFMCILGGNGAGKTTTLKILSGLKKLYKGKFRIWGKKLKDYKGTELYRNNISLLPQNPQTLFVRSTVIDDLMEVVEILKCDKTESEKLIKEITEKLEISHLLDRHPYDLSGGEQQKVAFAKILLTRPRIILLDEPTKGLDAYSKKSLAEILFKLKSEGMTICMVTHDIEFAGEFADRCCMFFDGQIVSSANPTEFFSTNTYYTTSAMRISRGFFENSITADMVVSLCNENGKK